MNVVITGAEGFLAKNLRVGLQERTQVHITGLSRQSTVDEWRSALATADFVYHLAGTNRPLQDSDYERGNVDLTAELCRLLAESGRKATLVFSSSTQAELDNPYGKSKARAECVVQQYADATGARACVLRLPNVFGKWARPNYNSAIATFCHNLVNGIPLTIHDRTARLRLAYIDDVSTLLIRLLSDTETFGLVDDLPVFETTVGELADSLSAIHRNRETLMIPPVGAGLTRALYSTYVSYLRPADFSYRLTRHEDRRGVFAEFLQTMDSGQVSFFTAHPGVTRGEHYHHTKTEKFLVVKGRARFCFRNIVTAEHYELTVDGDASTVVETVPGWAHSITNVGDDELIALLWANEVFDPYHPDTIAAKVEI